MRTSLSCLFSFLLLCTTFVQAGDPLPGTAALTSSGDLASEMIDGIHLYLDKRIRDSSMVRDAKWQKFPAATEDYYWGVNQKTASKAEVKKHQENGRLRIEVLQKDHRERLALMLGVRDERVQPVELDFVLKRVPSSTGESGKIASSEKTPQEKTLQAHVIRWPVLPGVWGEGLLIEPITEPQAKPILNVIAIPDADQTPEQFAGIVEGVEPKLQYARLLAASGCRVFVPALVSRQVSKRGPPGEAGRAELTNREFVYRPAFELGRHVIGYEVQRILALVDLLKGKNSDSSTSAELAVVGYGEGGLIALASAALDTRIDRTYISGYFGEREEVWKEPIDRNLFGQLTEFGDAEMAALVLPRALIVDFTPGPTVSLRTQGGAPGLLGPTPVKTILKEVERYGALKQSWVFQGTKQTSESDLRGVVLSSRENSGSHWIDGNLAGTTGMPELMKLLQEGQKTRKVLLADLPDSDARQQRLVQQLIDHSQKLLHDSAKVRKKFFAAVDTKSVENFVKTVEPLREKFRSEIIGRIDHSLEEPNAKSRQSWESDRWTGYEVKLDVCEDVFAYGVLLLPKDLKPGEKRPVVVCQHGLEGRPTDVFLGDHQAYHDYAAKLCDRGYIVFAPQNIYIFQDRFRSLQRKANPLGLTLFSFMVPQHQQIVNWLKTLPNVDGKRIAFYGLSYGGKSAMRIPALVKDYCLSICSADFNEWIVKNASTTHGFSYVWTGEYEIFEFNLGNTFNYAEMAALICPRPFMVERGHFDGVGEDEWVGHEFAKVQNLYQARLGIGERTGIEWFVGPHTINGKGTFEFLDKHLKFER